MTHMTIVNGVNNQARKACGKATPLHQQPNQVPTGGTNQGECQSGLDKVTHFRVLSVPFTSQPWSQTLSSSQSFLIFQPIHRMNQRSKMSVYFHKSIRIEFLLLCFKSTLDFLRVYLTLRCSISISYVNIKDCLNTSCPKGPGRDGSELVPCYKLYCLG